MTTKKQKELALEEFCSILESRGWTKDKYDNYKKTCKSKDGKERIYRYNVKLNVIRYEVACVHEATQYSGKSTSWVRIRSIAIKDLPQIVERIKNKGE